jgi:hypothetical protein
LFRLTAKQKTPEKLVDMYNAGAITAHHLTDDILQKELRIA